MHGDNSINSFPSVQFLSYLSLSHSTGLLGNAALIVQFSDPEQVIAKFMKSVTRSIFIFD